MEDKKQRNQTSETQQMIECSKCHKLYAPTDGVQKPNGFVCKECNSKSHKSLWMFLAGGVIVVAAIATWLTIGNGHRTGEGFDGVGEIEDSISLSVNSNSVQFDLQTATAISSPVSTQNPISNLEEFKHAFEKSIESASNDNSTEVVIPSVSPLFKINTNYFTTNSDVLVREFASAYAKTNKEAILLVEGYTCDLGGANLNDRLSKARAEAVKKILIDAGISENKIEVKWYGKSRFADFKYSNKDEYRRVILSIK